MLTYFKEGKYYKSIKNMCEQISSSGNTYISSSFNKQIISSPLWVYIHASIVPEYADTGNLSDLSARPAKGATFGLKYTPLSCDLS